MGTKKKESRIQFNKKMIVRAARELFEEQGIEATKVDEIAARADCSKSTMYVYFKSKEEILNHILYEQMVELKDMEVRCIEELQGQGAEAMFYAVCRANIEYQQKYPIYYERLLDSIRVDRAALETDEMLAGIYQAGEELNDAMEQMLKEAIAAGEIRADIEIIPTVFFLWSGISETIRFAGAKEQYLKQRLGMSREEYMNYGFAMLYRSVRREK